MNISLFSCADLVQKRGDPTLVLCDLRERQAYDAGHIPGSLWVDRFELIQGSPPVPGLPASQEALSALFQRLGIKPHMQILAYDAQGGTFAGRFLWTLALMGHVSLAYLNGGFLTWQAEGFAVTTEQAVLPPSETVFQYTQAVLATKQEILENLQMRSWQLWDTRSLPEYQGLKPLGRAGHLPGALHYEWLQALDEQGMIRPLAQVRAELAALGIVPEKCIVPYCHSHHRSAFAFMLLGLLGFPTVKAYAGSFCEWSLDMHTPIV